MKTRVVGATFYAWRREWRNDYRVWLVSSLTGDRIEVVSMHTNALAAQRDCRKRNAALGWVA